MSAVIAPFGWATALDVLNRLDVYNVGGWGIASNQDFSRVRLKNQQIVPVPPSTLSFR